MKTDPNSPAFATTESIDYSGQIGLSKREYFAAMALQGICADSVRTGRVDAYAQDAVAFADALIAELNK